MGAWPDLTEYHEAVQHPPRAFADPGLKAVTLELDRFGMPKPATGGNAVVYKANEPGGLLHSRRPGQFAASCARSATMPNVMRRSPNIFARSACPMMLIFSFSSRAFEFAPTGSLSSKCNGRMATFCTVILRSIYAIRPHWRHCGQNGSHLFATWKPLRWRTAIYSTVISWCAADRSSWWTTTACGCRP